MQVRRRREFVTRRRAPVPFVTAKLDRARAQAFPMSEQLRIPRGARLQRRPFPLAHARRKEVCRDAGAAGAGVVHDDEELAEKT